MANIMNVVAQVLWFRRYQRSVGRDKNQARRMGYYHHEIALGRYWPDMLSDKND